MRCRNKQLILRKKIPFHYTLSGDYPKIINKLRSHRPTFARQVAFDVLIVVEMVLMLSIITTVDNNQSLINQTVLQNKNNIVLGSTLLYVASLVLKLCYYNTHPWPLKQPNWKNVKKMCKNIAKMCKNLAKILFYPTLGLLLISFIASSLLLPILSIFLGPSPDMPELSVYSLYNNQTAEWILNKYYYGTNIIGYSWIAFWAVFTLFYVCFT